ncbi:Haloacid dehalogenase-like hydrolase domain-containing protein 3 [Coemansia sp. Benny D115]|nr:Haloacid dehalogenase-like hydrolase domain-containing protein 3 [Coemansia sp. Benny D115]
MTRHFGNIRLITFDLFDTLYAPTEPVSRTYARPLWRQGIKIDEATVAAAFYQAFKDARREYPNYGYAASMSSRQWWDIIIRRTWSNVNVDVSKYPKLASEIPQLIDYFGNGKGYTMFPEVPKVLKYLRRKGVKMGVVSNMDESGEKILAYLGIREYFDFVIQSIKVGVEKPDPRIYNMAMTAVSVPPFDSLHVGDSELLDYLPAKEAGMEAILVTRNRDGVEWDSQKHIDSLSRLLELV